MVSSVPATTKSSANFVVRRGLSGWRRPLLQHLAPLPDCKPYTRPMADRLREDLSRFVQVVAGIEHVVDLGAVLGPFSTL